MVSFVMISKRDNDQNSADNKKEQKQSNNPDNDFKDDFHNEIGDMYFMPNKLSKKLKKK